MRSTTLTCLALFFLSSTQAIQLKLAQNYSGSTFFDAWTFYNGIDANTTGNVLYQTREQAASERLAYVNSAGRAIMKVDNTTSGVNDPTFGRPSIKISSNATVSAGSLVLMDAVHMPFGCSVWPAFWMQGVNWPDDGEIDIVEQVNLQTNNRYTLHTLNGCHHPDASASATIETGQVISTDCFNQTNGDEGCIVQDPSSSSFGAGFASSGGGVFAMLWDDTGIKIWFFNRSSIPTDLPTASPNPSGWPTPTAFFPISACDTTKFFGPQTMIFDTTICGNFAGAANVFNPSCSGTCTDLVQTPSNYNDAYFEISYVRVFSNGSDVSATSSASSSSTSTPSSNKGGAPRSIIAATLLTILAIAGVLAIDTLATIVL